MKILIDNFFIDWDELEIPEEYKIMKKYADNSRRLSMGYSCKKKLLKFLSSYALLLIFSIKLRFNNLRIIILHVAVYCFMTVCMFMCTSLIPQILDIVSPLNESRPALLPYPGYYFINEKEYFLYIFCHSIVAWEIAIIGFVAHDCIFLTCVEHVCSIFAVAG